MLILDDIDIEDLLAIQAASQVTDVVIDRLRLMIVIVVVEEFGHDFELLLIDGHDVLICL